MSFFYEEAGIFVKRRAVGSIGSVVPRTEATQRWTGSAMGLQPCMFTGDFMGSAHRSPVARSAGRVSRRFHLLAAVADVGRAGRLAAGLAEAAGADGRARAAGLGGGISGRDLRHREKGASGSARHVVGKVRSAWWWSTAAAYLSERNLRPRKSPNTGLRKARSNR